MAGFSINSAGALSPIANTVVSTLPEGSTNLDMAISADGKYLSNVLSGACEISVFTINANGTVNQLGSIEGLPQTVGFNGIAAL